MYFKGQFILIFKVLHFIYFQIGPESHHASDIDVVLYQPISQPLKFSEDLLMNIETQKSLNTEQNLCRIGKANFCVFCSIFKRT